MSEVRPGDKTFPDGTQITVLRKIPKFQGTVEMHICLVDYPGGQVEIALRNFLSQEHRYVGSLFLMPPQTLPQLVNALTAVIADENLDDPK